MVNPWTQHQVAWPLAVGSEVSRLCSAMLQRSLRPGSSTCGESTDHGRMKNGAGATVPFLYIFPLKNSYCLDAINVNPGPLNPCWWTTARNYRSEVDINEKDDEQIRIPKNRKQKKEMTKICGPLWSPGSSMLTHTHTAKTKACSIFSVTQPFWISSYTTVFKVP